MRIKTDPTDTDRNRKSRACACCRAKMWLIRGKMQWQAFEWHIKAINHSLVNDLKVQAVQYLPLAMELLIASNGANTWKWVKSEHWIMCHCIVFFFSVQF